MDSYDAKLRKKLWTANLSIYNKGEKGVKVVEMSKNQRFGKKKRCNILWSRNKVVILHRFLTKARDVMTVDFMAFRSFSK